MCREVLCVVTNILEDHIASIFIWHHNLEDHNRHMLIFNYISSQDLQTGINVKKIYILVESWNCLKVNVLLKDLKMRKM
jgi:hypothetical protein